MKIHIASDHAAFELKNLLVAHLSSAGYQVMDHGPTNFDPEDDYPDTCIPCAEAVVADPGSLGIVLGGSGNGEQMSANLVLGVRAALAWNVETAKLARAHNDANVLSIGARMHETAEAFEIVDAFLQTEFSAEPRHQRRIDLMSHYAQAHRVSIES